MSETADKALDLADKWANAISEKLSQAAPGAQDVAIEAAKVKMGSELLGWLLLVVAWVLGMLLIRFFWNQAERAQRDDERRNRDEEVPWFVATFFTSVAMVFLTVAVFVDFPRREVLGLFAPRGYIALMVFDAAKK